MSLDFGSCTKLSRKLGYCQRGAAAVELALLTLPMVIMSMFTVDAARAVYEYNILVKAVRDSARILSAFDPADGANYPTDLAIRRVVYTDAVSNARLSGLTTGMVKYCDRENSADCPGETFANVQAGTGTVNLVQVKVEGYQFTPLFGGSLVPTISFGPVAATMMAVR